MRMMNVECGAMWTAYKKNLEGFFVVFALTSPINDISAIPQL